MSRKIMTSKPAASATSTKPIVSRSLVLEVFETSVPLRKKILNLTGNRSSVGTNNRLVRHAEAIHFTSVCVDANKGGRFALGLKLGVLNGVPDAMSVVVDFLVGLARKRFLGAVVREILRIERPDPDFAAADSRHGPRHVLEIRESHG